MGKPEIENSGSKSLAENGYAKHITSKCPGGNTYVYWKAPYGIGNIRHKLSGMVTTCLRCGEEWIVA